jgi:hypothetical protein
MPKPKKGQTNFHDSSNDMSGNNNSLSPSRVGESKIIQKLLHAAVRSERCSKKKTQKHTTGGIPRWSPTLVLVARFSAYVWQSGRDAQFSLTYGRMWDSQL